MFLFFYIDNGDLVLARFKSGTSTTLPNTNTFLNAVASTILRTLISGLNSVQQFVSDIAAFINGFIASVISFLNSLYIAV